MNTYPRLTPELCCTDYQESLRFYTCTLGFSVAYSRPEEGFAMLEYQGAELMIDEIVPGSPRSWLTGPMERPFGRGINLQIETDNVDSLYARIQESGHDIFLAMEEKWYRADDVYVGNKQFLVQDPDGYLLRFYQDMGTRDHP